MESKFVAALLLAPVVLGLAGCAVDSKLPSSDTYTYTENARMLASKDAKQQALAKASDVCAEKTLLPLESGRSSSDTYQVTFRCLTPSASERPVMAQNPDSLQPSR